MSDLNSGGPAFPTVSYAKPGDGYGTSIMTITGGMTLQQYAAIKLRVPKSGTEWLDAMIRESMRDELAAKAMQGMLACPQQPQSGEDMYARDAYTIADAMLKAREVRS